MVSTSEQYNLHLLILHTYIAIFLMFSFYYLPFTIFQVFPCSMHYFDSIILLFSFFLELLLFYPWQFLSHTSTYLFYSIQVYQQFFYHLCLQKSIFQLFPNTNLITINQTISSTLICFLNFIWRNYFTIYSAIIFINKRCIYYFAICCNYY